MNKHTTCVTACALLAAGSAFADVYAELKACRQINDVTRRMACYDGLPLAAPAAVSAPAAVTAAIRPPAPAAAAASAATAQFGIEDRNRPELAAAMDSGIPGRFEGWEPRDRIKLANGQVWQIVDDSRGVLYKTDPKVRVRRGAFGTFYLDIEGTNRSPRVTRVE